MMWQNPGAQVPSFGLQQAMAAQAAQQQQLQQQQANLQVSSPASCSPKADVVLVLWTCCRAQVP